MGSALALILSLGFLAGFGESSHAVRYATPGPTRQSSRTPGRLVGGIVFRGRGHKSDRYQRGWVEIGENGQLVTKQYVKAGHRYHFTLAPDTYDVAGYAKFGPCRGTATITSGRTTVQNVYCVFH